MTEQLKMIAVRTIEAMKQPELRGVWWNEVRKMQIGKAGEMKTLLNHVLKLLMGDNHEKLDPELTGAYEECWEKILFGIGVLRNDAGVEEEMSLAELEKVFLKYLNSRSYEELYASINENKDNLFSDKAEAFIDNLINQYQNDPVAVQDLNIKRKLLKDCKEHGVSEIFKPIQVGRNQQIDEEIGKIVLKYLNANGLDELREVIEEHENSLFSDEAEKLIDLVIEQYKNKPDAVQDLITKKELLIGCKEQALAKTFKTIQEQQNLNKEFQQLLHLQEMAKNHPELWKQVIKGWEVLTRKAEDVKDKNTQTCAMGNLATTFSNLYEVSGNEKFAKRAEELFNELNQIFTREETTESWAMTQHNLGNLYWRKYGGSGSALDAEAAAEYYQEALEVRTKEKAPADWAMTQYSLGNLYAKKYERSGSDLEAEAAVVYYQGALEVYKKGSAPAKWAMTQRSLGALYFTKYERSSAAEDAEAAENHYQGALEVYQKESAPADWAMTQHSLGTLSTTKYERSGTEGDAEAAAGYYQRALEVYKKERVQLDWARTQHSLGILYSQKYERSGAKRDAAAAANYYRGASEVYKKGIAPADWAMTQLNLGTLYTTKYERSGTAEDAEAAAGYYQGALEVYKKESAPADWAMTQLNLSNLYLIKYELSGVEWDAVCASGCLEGAQEVYRKESTSIQWARVQQNLGSLYSRKYKWSKAEGHAVAAADYYLVALEIYKKESASADCAMTQHSLGSLYSSRYERNKAEGDAEHASGFYQGALDEWKRENRPIQSAMTNHSLGSLYSTKYECSGSVEDAEAAARYYEGALEIYQKESAPAQWAMTHHSFGNLYSTKYNRSGSVEDAEAAAGYYQGALKIRKKENAPSDWAMTQLSLGNLYSTKYERSGSEGDAEAAAGYYEGALEIYQKESAPANWATVQYSLGNLYFRKYDLSGAAGEAETAAGYYQSALAVRKRESAPANWATVQHSLGTLYSTKYERSGLEEDVEVAAGCYQGALEEWTKVSAPANWATVQHSLGNLYFRKYLCTGSKVDATTTADYYEGALEEWTKESAPANWAVLHHNLGNLYSTKYDRSGSEREAEAAAGCYQRILSLSEAVSLAPIYPFRAARALTHLNYRKKDWKNTTQNYQIANQWLDQLYRVQFQRKSKENWLKEIRGLASQAAYAYAKEGYEQNAVLALEQGRARLLSEQLSRIQVELAELAKKKPELAKNYQTLTHEINTIQIQDLQENRLYQTTKKTQPSNNQDKADEYKKKTKELDDLIDQIRRVDGYEDFLKPVDFAKIRQAAKESPLVYFAVTAAGGLVLIVGKDGQVIPVWVDEINEKNLNEEVLMSQKELDGYLGAYDRWRQSQSKGVLKTEKEIAENEWMQALEETTQWLWDHLMEKVVFKLKELHISEAVLIPQGLLGLLPLHAAWTVDETKPIGRHYAFDEIIFRYASNAQALLAAQKNESKIKTEHLLAIDNPDDSLHFSSEEVDTAVKYFPNVPRRLIKEKAMIEVVKDEIPQCNILHFSCHGIANFNQPLEGGLKMADGMLTLRDMLQLNLENTRLAILSACETGVPGLELLDEVVSLPTALAQSGAVGVIGSLWSVSDASTMMLMARFYELWREDGLEPYKALQTAQKWMRDTTNGEKQTHFKKSIPGFTDQKRMSESVAQLALSEVLLERKHEHSYAHPYYWAAFGYTGI